MVFAVVTGGGTSGHVVPAIAVLEALQDAGHPAGDLAYVGSRRGIESSVAFPEGVAREFLPVSGLQRSFSPRSIVRNMAFPFRLAVAGLMARALVRRWKPSVVVSVGGYASEPMARAAVAAGVPLVCISYDASPGLATRRQSRRASVCAVAFEGIALPNAVVTGAPVRRSVRTMDREATRRTRRSAMGLAEDTVLVTFVGGSLGSQVINDAARDFVSAAIRAGAVGSFLDRETTGDAPVVRIHVRHLTGFRFHVPGSADSPGNPSGTATVSVETAPYEDDMPGLLAASDIVVSRAGASTVAEISAIGVASVLVPWPGAADNHQESNARWLSDGSAAVTVVESATVSADVTAQVLRLAHDRVERSRIAAAALAKGAGARGSGLAETIEKAALAR